MGILEQCFLLDNIFGKEVILMMLARFIAYCMTFFCVLPLVGVQANNKPNIKPKDEISEYSAIEIIEYMNDVNIHYDTLVSTISTNNGFRMTPDVFWGMDYDELLKTLPHPEQVMQDSPFYKPSIFDQMSTGGYCLSPFEKVKFSDIDINFSLFFMFDEEEQLNGGVYRIMMDAEQEEEHLGATKHILDSLSKQFGEPLKGGEYISKELTSQRLKDEIVDVMWSSDEGYFLRLNSFISTYSSFSSCHIIIHIGTGDAMP